MMASVVLLLLLLLFSLSFETRKEAHVFVFVFEKHSSGVKSLFSVRKTTTPHIKFILLTLERAALDSTRRPGFVTVREETHHGHVDFVAAVRAAFYSLT